MRGYVVRVVRGAACHYFWGVDLFIVVSKGHVSLMPVHASEVQGLRHEKS